MRPTTDRCTDREIIYLVVFEKLWLLSTTRFYMPVF